MSNPTGPRLVAEVDVGDGGVMQIPNPQSYENGGICWQLSYGSPDQVRYIAAGVLESYDYLLCGRITMKEATRRLRLLRKTYACLRDGAK